MYGGIRRCTEVYGGVRQVCTEGEQVPRSSRPRHRRLAWRRGLCRPSDLVMRLREPGLGRQSQPETARWVNKEYFKVSSPALRLVFAGQVRLTHGPTGPWVSPYLLPTNSPYATGSDGQGRTAPSLSCSVHTGTVG